MTGGSAADATAWPPSPRRTTRCRRMKAYLCDRRPPCREVDVSRDPAPARDLVRRTGQPRVPVVEVGRRPVVGFDRDTIDRLLELAPPRR